VHILSHDAPMKVNYYWVAEISRIDQIIGVVCRISSFYRALLQKGPVILSILPIEATPYAITCSNGDDKITYTDIETMEKLYASK